VNCPVPISEYQQIVLGHGSGGRLSADLLSRVFLPAFPVALEDAATLPRPEGRIALTTDAFVVRPIFFPGGDIGKVAVCGTLNDLAVSGARPLYLSAAFILEEGLAVDDLRRIVASMKNVCEQAGVQLVCGDTKVVDRGKGDQVFITTTGVGVVPDGRQLSISSAKPGDRVMVSGTLGDHGIAVLSTREGLRFDTALQSDCAPLHDLCESIADRVRCMRDPTRGGLSSALHELAAASHVGVLLDEAALPLRPEVRAACEILGLDPLYVANEGKVMAVVPPEAADSVLQTMRAHPLGKHAAIVGEVRADPLITIRSRVGGERVVPLLAGEQLPRIC
jgi:hydrogenase expression/formation protein HypE